MKLTDRPAVEIIEQVSSEYGVSIAELLGRERREEVLDARTELVGALRSLGPSAVGRIIRRTRWGVRWHERRYDRLHGGTG